MTVTTPDGTALVSAAAVTVSSSIATYPLFPASTETLGEKWSIAWDLLVGTDRYQPREQAILVEYAPVNGINVRDLFRRLPELEHRVPQSQGTRGDSTGWQPQIDDTFYELINWYVSNGQRAWTCIGIANQREWMIARACQRCVQSIPAPPDSNWARASTELFHEERRAKASLKLTYPDDTLGIRRGASPVIRLAPVGRPSW